MKTALLIFLTVISHFSYSNTFLKKIILPHDVKNPVMVQMNDSLYVIAVKSAYTNNFQSLVTLIGVDSSGDLRWTTTLPYHTNPHICRAGTGKFAIAAEDTSHNCNLFLFSQQGFLINSITLTDVYSVFNVKPANDSGIAILGQGISGNATFICKLDSALNKEWQTKVQFSITEIYDAVTMADGGFLAAGMTIDITTNNDDGMLIRFDSQGNVLWEKPFVPQFGALNFIGLHQSKDSSFFGFSYFLETNCFNAYSGSDFFRFDSAGNLLSSVHPSCNMNSMYYIVGATATSDNGMAFLVKTADSSATKLQLMKADTSGNILFMKSFFYGSAPLSFQNYTDYYNDILPLYETTRGFVFLSTDSNQVVFVKTDSNGDISCNQPEMPYQSDSTWIATGHTIPATISTDTTTFSSIFISTGIELPTVIDLCTGVGISEIQEDDLVIYPNPASGSFTISWREKIRSVVLTDVSGKLLFEKHFSGSESNPVIDVHMLSQGFYFVRVVGDRIADSKILINK